MKGMERERKEWTKRELGVNVPGNP